MATEMLQRAFAVTRSVLANVKTDQLDDPTPCASWTVRDLLNHMIGGTQFFAGAMSTGSAPQRDSRDLTGGDIVASYDDGMAQVIAAFGAPGAQERMVTLWFGTIPGAAFMGLATTDTFLHGWDLARATGQSADLDPELASQLLENARAVVQPAFRGDDGTAPFGPEQVPPAGATAADRLAAFLGRAV